MYIRFEQFNCYDHVQRMNEERLPQNTLKWCPLGKIKGRPQNSWIQEVTTRMRAKGINSMEWTDREK